MTIRPCHHVQELNHKEFVRSTGLTSYDGHSEKYPNDTDTTG